MNSGAPAVFSPDRRYRYLLRRHVSILGKGVCLFIMLNPSTADEELNDPSVRRCIRFAAGWGYAHLIVANIFALRSTDPKALYAVGADPVGPENDMYLGHAVSQADRVIAAWGNHGAYRDRGIDVARMIPIPYCLGLTNSGQPRHPLYVWGQYKPEPFNY